MSSDKKAGIDYSGKVILSFVTYQVRAIGLMKVKIKKLVRNFEYWIWQIVKKLLSSGHFGKFLID